MTPVPVTTTLSRIIQRFTPDDCFKEDFFRENVLMPNFSVCFLSIVILPPLIKHNNEHDHKKF